MKKALIGMLLFTAACGNKTNTAMKEDKVDSCCTTANVNEGEEVLNPTFK